MGGLCILEVLMNKSGGESIRPPAKCVCVCVCLPSGERENTTAINSIFPALCNLMPHIDGGGREEKNGTDTFRTVSLHAYYMCVKIQGISITRLHRHCFRKSKMFFSLFKCIFFQPFDHHKSNSLHLCCGEAEA